MTANLNIQGKKTGGIKDWITLYQWRGARASALPSLHWPMLGTGARNGMACPSWCSYREPHYRTVGTARPPACVPGSSAVLRGSLLALPYVKRNAPPVACQFQLATLASFARIPPRHAPGQPMVKATGNRPKPPKKPVTVIHWQTAKPP